MTATRAHLRTGTGQPVLPVRQLGAANARAPRLPDQWTLFIVAIMSLLTISTPAVELFGVPRITVLSIPFTLYMLIRIGWRIERRLIIFIVSYVGAFLPATIAAFIRQDIKTNSLVQGVAGLITMAAIASYFYNWMMYTPGNIKKRNFINLAQIFFVIALVETIFYNQFFNLRQSLYPTNVFGASISLDRELSLYGGRPMSLFSEPSHFARYIGLMMAAFIAVTQRRPVALAAGGLFMVVTRSVSYFFALPALAVQVLYAIRADEGPTRKSRNKKRLGFRLIAVGVMLALVVSGVVYTQSERLAGAFGGRSATSGAVSGDGSLNERVLIPIGYLFNGERSIVLGLGPTPQEEMQRYTLLETRLLYHWSGLSSDYNSAVSASIFIIVGMGYIGIIVFSLLMFSFQGLRGIYMMLSFMLANMLSSGYNSTTSLVPSGLLLAVILYQQSQVPVTAPTPPRTLRRTK